MATVVKLVIIGVVAGISSGFFGIGGGIVIVPVLIYWVGYNQHLLAVGTSLAVLLPPVGLAATLEYYRKGECGHPGGDDNCCLDAPRRLCGRSPVQIS